MVIAIVIGAVIGFLGFLPLIFGMNKAKNATPTSNIGHAGGLLIGVGLSFVVIIAGMIACIFVARDMALPFVLAEAIALVVTAIGFGISRHFRK